MNIWKIAASLFTANALAGKGNIKIGKDQDHALLDADQDPLDLGPEYLSSFDSELINQPSYSINSLGSDSAKAFSSDTAYDSSEGSQLTSDSEELYLQFLFSISQEDFKTVKAQIQFAKADMRLLKGLFTYVDKGDRNSAFLVAASVKKPDIFNLLLESATAVPGHEKWLLDCLMHANANGYTALFLAARWDFHRLDRLLETITTLPNHEMRLKNGLLRTDAKGATALIAAANQPDANGFNLLLETATKLPDSEKLVFDMITHQIPHSGYTALLTACSMGYPDIVSALLKFLEGDEAKIRWAISQSNEQNIGPLSMALQEPYTMKNIVISKMLLKLVENNKSLLDKMLGSIDINGDRPFIMAVNQINTEVIEAIFDLVKEDKELLKELMTQTNKAGYTALQAACQQGKTDFMSVLLQAIDGDLELLKTLATTPTRFGDTILQWVKSGRFKNHVLQTLEENKDWKTMMADSSVLDLSKTPNATLWYGALIASVTAIVAPLVIYFRKGTYNKHTAIDQVRSVEENQVAPQKSKEEKALTQKEQNAQRKEAQKQAQKQAQEARAQEAQTKKEQEEKLILEGKEGKLEQFKEWLASSYGIQVRLEDEKIIALKTDAVPISITIRMEDVNMNSLTGKIKKGLHGRREALVVNINQEKAIEVFNDILKNYLTTLGVDLKSLFNKIILAYHFDPTANQLLRNDHVEAIPEPQVPDQPLVEIPVPEQPNELPIQPQKENIRAEMIRKQKVLKDFFVDCGITREHIIFPLSKKGIVSMPQLQKMNGDVSIQIDQVLFYVAQNELLALIQKTGKKLEKANLIQNPDPTSEEWKKIQEGFKTGLERVLKQEVIHKKSNEKNEETAYLMELIGHLDQAIKLMKSRSETDPIAFAASNKGSRALLEVAFFSEKIHKIGGEISIENAINYQIKKALEDTCFSEQKIYDSLRLPIYKYDNLFEDENYLAYILDHESNLSVIKTALETKFMKEESAIQIPAENLKNIEIPSIALGGGNIPQLFTHAAKAQMALNAYEQGGKDLNDRATAILLLIRIRTIYNGLPKDKQDKQEIKSLFGAQLWSQLDNIIQINNALAHGEAVDDGFLSYVSESFGASKLINDLTTENKSQQKKAHESIAALSVEESAQQSSMGVSSSSGHSGGVSSIPTQPGPSQAEMKKGFGNSGASRVSGDKRQDTNPVVKTDRKGKKPMTMK